jgi:UDP-2-acetamido-2,6-beta-L-arabino-hexul-4-ose reductase
MKILVTGAEGFIGKNFITFISTNKEIQILPFGRKDGLDKLSGLINQADYICHFAGINRAQDDKEFLLGNIQLTEFLCECIRHSGKAIPVLYTSSIQAELDNNYGMSKKMSEDILLNYSSKYGFKVFIYRLPNVFGKWGKPDYNSVVSTFCYKISSNQEIKIQDPDKSLKLVYIDDVVKNFKSLIINQLHNQDEPFKHISPVYQTTVGQLAALIYSFKESRANLIVDRVGDGFIRALYATYVSYLSNSSFSYKLKSYEDARGKFVEFVKTKDSGQVSYFTTVPGVTRGGHFHHSKTEKFLVIKGSAKFRFRNIITSQYHELTVSDEMLEVVETVPGWVHDITNIGEDLMIVMIWANELLDRNNPDTYAAQVLL